MVERLWRRLKHEPIYLHDAGQAWPLRRGPSGYFPFSNHKKWYQALANRTPLQVLKGCPKNEPEGGQQ